MTQYTHDPEAALPGLAPGCDRRRWSRYELDISLIARLAANRTRIFSGRVLDLSHGGVSALIAADLRLGDVVELHFSLPYAVTHVLVESVVRSRERYRYGLEFVHVTASDQKTIDMACNALRLLK